MREIRFRGKDKVTGEWRFGYYARLKNEFKEWHCIMTEQDATHNYIKDGDAYRMSYTAVEEDTVGQFTGLFDKNGTEIYEGDIVEMMRTPKGKRKRVLTRHVVTAESLVTWKFKSLSVNVLSLLMSGFGFRDAYMFKVIGNIYDNPELLNN